jgi:hypothetical protein
MLVDIVAVSLGWGAFVVFCAAVGTISYLACDMAVDRLSRYKPTRFSRAKIEEAERNTKR